MSAFGASIPTAAPVVDLSQYPDNVAEMKKLLVEKDAKIKALEKRVEALNKEVKADEVEKLDMVDKIKSKIKNVSNLLPFFLCSILDTNAWVISLSLLFFLSCFLSTSPQTHYSTFAVSFFGSLSFASCLN